MRAFIVDTGRLISPFGERPHQAAWAGTTVGAAVRAALTARGFEVVDVAADGAIDAGAEKAVVLADHTFVSDKCLGDFLDASFELVAGGASTRLALCRTEASAFLLPVSSCGVEPLDESGPGARPQKAWRSEQKATERIVYDAFMVPPKTQGQALTLLASLRESATRVVVNKRELHIPLRLPVLGDATRTQTVVPVTSTVAGHIEHWTHVLWLNQLAFGVRWMEIARGHKLWMALRVLLALPWSMPRIMRRLVWKAKGVDVHPTAHVEGSILGAGVVVGPRASVRNCVLGDGVVVGDHATVLSSVLGPRTVVTPRTFVVWSASYEDAVLTNYKLQVSLVGRGASLSTWAGLIDAKLQGVVEVKHDGALRSTERSFLGSCIGHGAFVGAKVLVLPGREIPNGALLAMRPDELIGEIPPGLPAGVPLVRDDGKLVPLEQLLARRGQLVARPTAPAT